jgi:sugar phosphate isomerase/epimerase
VWVWHPRFIVSSFHRFMPHNLTHPSIGAILLLITTLQEGIAPMATPIALQLYTLRDALEADFETTMHRIASYGYAGVETAFFAPHISHRYAREFITSLGLQICSIHCELPIGNQRESVLQQAADLGAQRIVWHGWPEDSRYGSIAGIAELAAEYNQAAHAATQAGLTLGIHNHWWECQQVVGQYAYQHLLPQLDPTIFWELDAYWATVAGCDPIAMLHELGPRVPLLHLKDGPATPDALKMALGTGALPIPAILAAAKHAEWLIVELDDYAGDMFEAVDQSVRYLQAQQ